MQAIELLSVIGLILWIVLSLALATAAIWLLPSLRRFVNVTAGLERLLAEFGDRMRPAVNHIERAADNANYITAAVRADVARVSRTLDHAADALDGIVELAEERATEISGFLEVVQEEAEETFYTTASLIRGLRAGRRLVARRESRPRKRRRRRTG